MRLLLLSLLTAAGLSLGQADITATNLGNLSTMPGSTVDFNFFGSATQFPNIANHYFGDGIQPYVLTHFTVSAPSTDNAYGAGPGPNSDTRYSSIYTPASSVSTVQTGILFSGGSTTPVNLSTFTLGALPDFNYADFDVYVMYGNGQGDGNVRDTSLYLNLASSSGSIASITQAVTDSNTDITKASFYEFEVTGGSSGDTLTIGAAGPNLSYLGGVSFESVPEPSTYVLLLECGALVLLVQRVRRLKA